MIPMIAARSLLPMSLIKSQKRVADYGEVFTPPAFANRMLNTLAGAWATSHDGAHNWTDKIQKFNRLDS
jgi:hypothetical protein